MKFTVVKDDLLPFIQHANSFTSPKNLNTVLQNILIIAEDQSITFRATNLQVGFSGQLSATVEETGIITVSGKKLLDIVRELPDQAVINFTFDGSKLVIKSGRSSFKLSTIGPEMFPTMSNITAEYYLKVSGDTLLNLMRRTQFCISNDLSKIEYTGGHFTVAGNRLEVSAADFQRVATASATFDIALADEFIINIPKKTIQELLKLVSPFDTVEIETDKKQVLFRAGSFTIYSKLIEKYIKSLTRLFKSEYPIQATLNRKEFIEVVKRVSTITSEITHGVQLTFKDDTMTVSSLETEYGQGHESMECKLVGGEDMEIVFNSKHIMEICGNIDSENITLKMSGRRAPALVSPDDSGYEYLVVPLSIEKV